ncbi:MAG: metal ABC transporter ATP-binding protein [Clostridia bacterium]|jgi:zinc transport system ATP-binding protein
MQTQAVMERQATMDTKPKSVALEFHHVSYSYGDVAVLGDASFHIHEGEFTALVGPNGAGKTTILRLLLGLARPSAGRVLVFGADPEESRDSIGYVPQNSSFDPAFPISVEEVVRMGRLRGGAGRYSPADRRFVDRALDLADVADLGRRSYTALSGGQRRRVLIARALAGRPRFLVLDEPTANMDAESETRLYRVLGDLKGETTILVVTHDTGFVSALTDAVLCVGERGSGGKAGGKTGGRGVVRHASVPADHVPSGLYGGEALRVLHDTELPDDGCCCGREDTL